MTEATGFSITLVLPHNNETNPVICRYDTDINQWDCAADSFTTTTVTRSGITEFSDWLVSPAADVVTNPYVMYLPIIQR